MGIEALALCYDRSFRSQFGMHILHKLFKKLPKLANVVGTDKVALSSNDQLTVDIKFIGRGFFYR